MSTEVRIPRLAESISEAVLVEWLKQDGAGVAADEAIATLETDKAAVEIAAPEPGTLRHARAAGETVLVGDVIARIEAGVPAVAAKAAGEESERPSAVPASAGGEVSGRPSAVPAKTGSDASVRVSVTVPGSGAVAPAATESPATDDGALSPAVRRLIEEHRLDPTRIPASGRGGRLLKEDVLRHLEESAATPAGSAGGNHAPAPVGAATAPGAVAAPRVAVPPASTAPASTAPASTAPASAAPASAAPASLGGPAESAADERVVPMSRIRQRIAERLVQAQHTAAILTTFNEIDMSAVMELRARMKERFEKRHGVRLGFLSFFTHAAALALAEVPELNAEIRGADIVYKRRVHMGIAVSTERGLVVPVVRDAERLSFAGIEREVERMASRARDNTLTLQELSGGTFTLTNGGVFGSLLSTPILNPPQTGILGLHKIEKRPIAVDDQVVIRPMMYVALSYDHRLVDGQGAVTFLVKVKERLEDPERMLLDV